MYKHRVRAVAPDLERIIEQKNIRIKELEEESLDRLRTITRMECEISDLGWRIANE